MQFEGREYLIKRVQKLLNIVDDGKDGSGLHQVCMIMASAMMLSASVIRGVGEDDRMPPPDSNALSAKECAKWMTTQLDGRNMVNNPTIDE